MAPSSGHLLVPKMLKVARFAISKATALIRSKIPTQATASSTKQVLQPIRIPVSSRQPIHPIAYLRQLRSGTQSRLFTTSNGKTSTRPLRSSLPTSRVSQTIQQRGFTPFTSSLRPAFSGTIRMSTRLGTRNFSSGSVCHAQVVNNVSAAVRAFWLEGGRARYDGVDPHTGNKRFARVSETQDKGLKKIRHAIDTRSAKGSSLRFRVAPTVTSLTSLPGMSGSDVFESDQTLSPHLLAALSADFARGVQDLAAILADLKRIRDAYGDLPVHWEDGYVSVRFDGCDRKAVDSLADEAGVRRGIVVEDPGWGESEDRDVKMALLFPFAPEGEEGSDGVEDMFEPVHHVSVPMDPLSPIHEIESLEMSTRSLTSAEDFGASVSPSANPWAAESESDGGGTENEEVHGYSPGVNGSAGFESLYQFLAECDTARR